MKRVFLFLLTNLAVMLVLGVVLSIIMSALGLSHRSLGGILLIATVFGFGGSFISLFMSKWIAKKINRRACNYAASKRNRTLACTNGICAGKKSRY
ncbi:heat shock protein HtpX [Pseudoalteromonas sp. BSi20495]|nr:heat shock protein HtpX [Pseudoalteromonas sp. BSi20495]